jgi:pyrroline-5-carboxylate reductase
MKISFIGFGHLAQAIAQGLFNPHPTAALGLKKSGYQLFAAAPSLPEGINAQGITTTPDNLAVVAGADVVILAVKPKDMAGVLSEIHHSVPADCVVVSVAAGLPLSWFNQHCRAAQSIVRSMPNLAVAVGKGATPLIANQWVSAKQRLQVNALFESLGMVTWTDDESNIDRFTALSGSGPAYAFLFLEALVAGATQLGLGHEVARAFALQTVLGAVCLAEKSQQDISALRQQVTSKKGTTAAAIEVLQHADFEAMISRAMEAAYLRAQELANRT